MLVDQSLKRRNIMRRVLTLMGLVAIPLLAVPQESASQECDFFDYEDWQHWFTGELCDGDGGCKSCQIEQPEGHVGCHAAKISGYCWTHPLCDSVLAQGPPVDAEVLTVVANRDMDGATELIRSSGVRLNPVRRALQILGCKGAVVSHIPIDDAFYTQLSATLEQAATAASG